MHHDAPMRESTRLIAPRPHYPSAVKDIMRVLPDDRFPDHGTPTIMTARLVSGTPITLYGRSMLFGRERSDQY